MKTHFLNFHSKHIHEHLSEQNKAKATQRSKTQNMIRLNALKHNEHARQIQNIYELDSSTIALGALLQLPYVCKMVSDGVDDGLW